MVRAIEKRQPMRGGRKMRRRPVQDHADPVLVQVIHKYMKSSGVPCRLVGAKYPVVS
jgi:hypothetical protein